MSLHPVNKANIKPARSGRNLNLKGFSLRQDGGNVMSAAWYERELFFIPGGNQVNLSLNVPTISLVAIHGYDGREVRERHAAARPER